MLIISSVASASVSNSVESAGTFGFDSCSCVSVRYDSANYPLLSMSLPLYHELLSATGWTMPTSSPVSRGMNVKAVTTRYLVFHVGAASFLLVSMIP